MLAFRVRFFLCGTIEQADSLNVVWLHSDYNWLIPIGRLPTILGKN